MCVCVCIIIIILIVIMYAIGYIYIYMDIWGMVYVDVCGCTCLASPGEEEPLYLGQSSLAQIPGPPDIGPFVCGVTHQPP